MSPTWLSLLLLLATGCPGGSSPNTDSGTDALDTPLPLEAATDSPTDAVAEPEGGSDAGTPAIVTKPDGRTPSNFSCNHHFVDPPLEAPAAHAFAVSVISNTAPMPTPASTGTLSLIDPLTGATAGMPSAMIDATGMALLSLAGNGRSAWRVTASGSRCDPCIDTYEFNRLVGPDATGTTTPLSTEVFEIDHAAGWSEASGFLASQFLLGTILDCDGDPVMGASISVTFDTTNTSATLCPAANTGTDAVCFVFPQSRANPSAFFTSTGAVGQFLVYTQRPGAVSVRALGRLDPGDAAPTTLGTLDAMTFAGSLSRGTTAPLRN